MIRPLPSRILTLQEILKPTTLHLNTPILDPVFERRYPIIQGLRRMQHEGLIQELYCDEDRVSVRFVTEEYRRRVSWTTAEAVVAEFFNVAAKSKRRKKVA